MRVLRPFAAIVFVAAAAWPQPLSGAIDDIAIDSRGNILVAVTDLYQVLKIAPDGTVSVFAGTGRQRDYSDPGGDGGPAVAAELRRASSVTVDRLKRSTATAGAMTALCIWRAERGFGSSPPITPRPGPWRERQAHHCG